MRVNQGQTEILCQISIKRQLLNEQFEVICVHRLLGDQVEKAAKYKKTDPVKLNVKKDYFPIDNINC